MKEKENVINTEIVLNVVKTDKGEPVGIEFVAGPKYEIEQLVQNIPGKLVKGELDMRLPKIGDVCAITFLDDEENTVAEIPMSHEQSVVVDKLFSDQDKDISISVDQTIRYLTPSFRLLPLS